MSGWDYSPGERVHGWRLRRPLGAGSSAEVWEAADESGLRRAVKILTSRELPKIIRFVREIEIMSSVKADVVIPISHEHFPGAGRPPAMYAMPLAVALKYHLTGRELSLRERGLILLEAAICLHKLHELGIFHCDVKPRNILRVENRWVFGDFGLAMRANMKPIVAPDEIMGTRYYTAPELYEDLGDEAPDWRACDAFSFGQLMDVVMTGRPRPPAIDDERGRDPAALAELLRRLPYAGVIVETITRARALEPQDRPSMKAISSRLLEWLAASRLLPQRFDAGQADAGASPVAAVATA